MKEDGKRLIDGYHAALEKVQSVLPKKGPSQQSHANVSKSPMQTMSRAGEEVWADKSLRKRILKLMAARDRRRIAALNRQTFEDVVRIRYHRLDSNLYDKMQRLILPNRQPIYLSAVTTLDIRRPPRELSHEPRPRRSGFVSGAWLHLLPSLPALIHAHFEDLVLVRSSETGPPRASFEARRLITLPLRVAVKTPVPLAHPQLAGYDFVIYPEIDVELYSPHLRLDCPFHTYAENPVSSTKVFAKLVRQIEGSQNVFSHGIRSLTIGVPLPLSIFAVLYQQEDGHRRSTTPPSHLRLDCSGYDIKALETFCTKAAPRLAHLELGPVSYTVPSITCEDLLLDFDWASPGSLQTLKISVKISTLDEWLEAFAVHNRTKRDQSCTSHLRSLTIVFHGMPMIETYPSPQDQCHVQQYIDRLLNQLTCPPFLEQCREIFPSSVALSFKVWREHYHSPSGQTVDLPLLDELVKKKLSSMVEDRDHREADSA